MGGGGTGPEFPITAHQSSPRRYLPGECQMVSAMRTGCLPAPQPPRLSGRPGDSSPASCISPLGQKSVGLPDHLPGQAESEAVQGRREGWMCKRLSAALSVSLAAVSPVADRTFSAGTERQIEWNLVAHSAARWLISSFICALLSFLRTPRAPPARVVDRTMES